MNVINIRQPIPRTSKDKLLNTKVITIRLRGQSSAAVSTPHILSISYQIANHLMDLTLINNLMHNHHHPSNSSNHSIKTAAVVQDNFPMTITPQRRQQQPRLIRSSKSPKDSTNSLATTKLRTISALARSKS